MLRDKDSARVVLSKATHGDVLLPFYRQRRDRMVALMALVAILVTKHPPTTVPSGGSAAGDRGCATDSPIGRSRALGVRGWSVRMSSFSAPSSLCLRLVLPPLLFAPLVTRMNAFVFDGSTEEERERERVRGAAKKVLSGLVT